ncbi:MAG: DUF1446 domain-containing protein [Candidatus Eremiobacteraeota bacterium]|nr:DUF1446 domain-containing protein [Candidatus Eremiobacteraeota bacterium]
MKRVRIGGASGFWGDSSVSVPQLGRGGALDYISFDYLAEITMSILSRARAKDPAAGWATDFVDAALAGMLGEIASRRIRVVSNAGGVNPRACAAALARHAAEAGVRLRIAVVEGDDVLSRVDDLRARDVRDMFSGTPLPARMLSANAYLGAFPIATALERGADVVITGRCVDSALPLGALIAEFGWRRDDYDLLAAGSLVGHILECGAQGSGGLHTDWERVERWDDIGYPIAECSADGTFVVTKAPGTGGLVERAAVAEQMLYEVGDPNAYVLPDVVCDFTHVTMADDGPDRVKVAGARGRPCTADYKVSATFVDGMRAIGMLTIIGIDAAPKARRTAEAILARTRRMFAERGIADFRDTLVEILGAESVYGPHARTQKVREAVLRLSVEHDSRDALEIFVREIAPAGTSWSPGTTGFGGRPKPAPIVRLTSFLLAKSEIATTIDVDGERETIPTFVPDHPSVPVTPEPVCTPIAHAEREANGASADTIEVPLVTLAWARSGDKGDTANIGVIARDPAYLPLLRAALTPERVAAYFAHLVRGAVRRYDVPGIDAFNFTLDEALGGGGMASMRIDPLAKGMAQMLLDLPIAVPFSLAPPSARSAALASTGATR